MSEWIEHDGNGVPVDGKTWVRMKFRDNAELENYAYRADDKNPKFSLWVHKMDLSDITHYQIITEDKESINE